MVDALTAPGDLSLSSLWLNGLALLLLVFQLPAMLILWSRLAQGPGRRPPLQPRPTDPEDDPGAAGVVSVIVPTLNEARRIDPCLHGLIQQTREVREILVVDSHSTDGTADRVREFQARDSRIRLIQDDPLPAGWIGRPWALHTGFLSSSPESTWVLGVDADTQPHPALARTLIAAATAADYDLVSLAPQFILRTPGEWWLQPALLMTLVYRFGPAGSQIGGAERVMANGQCFLCRRALLTRLGGYGAARGSFCDDVTLARVAAKSGARVGFWDGSLILKVRMYEGMAETWREWGRSLDLKDAASLAQMLWDLWLLMAVQGLPWLLLPAGGAMILAGVPWSLTLGLLASLNLSLILTRVALLLAIRGAYDFTQTTLKNSWTFWLSPLADPLAAWRILLSALRTPTQWRGRYYPAA